MTKITIPATPRDREGLKNKKRKCSRKKKGKIDDDEKHFREKIRILEGFGL